MNTTYKAFKYFLYVNELRDTRKFHEQIVWGEEKVDRIKELIAEDKTNPEIISILKKEFGIKCTLNIFLKTLSRYKIKRGVKVIPKEEVEEVQEVKPFPKFNPKHESQVKRNKSKRKGMSEEVIVFIEDNYLENTDDELREMIADEFNVFHSVDKIAEYRESNAMLRPRGWSSEGFQGYDSDT